VAGEGDRCVQFGLRVTARTAHGAPLRSEVLPVSLRCRTAGQAFLMTFVDHDGSVQGSATLSLCTTAHPLYTRFTDTLGASISEATLRPNPRSVAHAAAIRPRGACPAGGCSIYLSMAGVGVKPQQQAESHKYMAKGQTDFSFGYKSMWVLAPERDGAHNWEGVGLQTALASLGALRALAARTDAPARADRIHVTGHSRGGHGALMVGLSQPDRCMSVSSLSGWYKVHMYNPYLSPCSAMRGTGYNALGLVQARVLRRCEPALRRRRAALAPRAGPAEDLRGRLRRGPSVILHPTFSFAWRIPIGKQLG
jgi:hypothetical protein